MRWQLDAPWFGGWSGIEIDAQGGQMTVINDRGQFATARLQRANGLITGVGVQNVTALGRSVGGPLEKKASDAEGLAIADNGDAFISFEHEHRIMQVDLSNGRTSNRIALPFQNAMEPNGGVEALAVGPDGTLYAITETPPTDRAPFPLYAYSDGQWRVSARIPQRGSFVPVGADFDANGRLWLLERSVSPLGFRSRVRLFVLDPRAPREHTLLTTVHTQYDNLEGISVWQDASGQMYVTMISDDNFLRILRTQIVEYRVTE
ncbi:esterase-like activity of phytase family protein [Sulfitobacter sp. S223]|uniref:esterase-like activity of phytase family protein n=1 Tax=Sulfitobacter sp. S223 TaxID=2867023 RepID=UPI0021A5D21B|nr:esterase-like activity of phytase family protein [Sulfitobacter sp. S223]UWR26236.1 esterase-like activity of phytase family protein [Sulfitobacter sp. S223]